MYRPDKATTYRHIDALFTDTIDWNRIGRHWQDLMQVALSIKMGRISSAVLLRKLGTYSRKNRLYQAFREVGCVLRTVYLLRYLSEVPLRELVTASTNKVESYHRLADWCLFGGVGALLEGDPEDLEKTLKHNQLLATAVMIMNALDLTQLIRQLRVDGYPVKRDDLALLSPYLTRHLKRFGDYVIDLESVPRPDEDEGVLPLEE